MRIKRSLQAAALIAAAVLLGLFTVQGTYALWNATAVATPGTVSAASFDMMLTPGTGQATTMTLSNGTAATVALSPTGTLGPGTPVHGALVVTNNTNAGGQFNTVVTAGTPAIANVNGGTLAGYISVSGKLAATTAECGNATGYLGIGTGLASLPVAKTASAIFCFQVSLNPGAPTSVKGQAVNITLPLTARQCGVSGGC
ncbi:SipW-dependent-type signal peptide-containing protein [Pseudarthrobacter enclensis]|uniref:SipW-dependent-type signal peptide-containing protein n=1 Tax=Pseudarthrobacter enclensis TaxID=993070 RepID=UPI003EE14DF4